MVNILKFDLEAIQDKIVLLNNPSYLIMHPKTLKLLNETLQPNVIKACNGNVCQLFGISIAICTAVPYGKVDIV